MDWQRTISSYRQSPGSSGFRVRKSAMNISEALRIVFRIVVIIALAEWLIMMLIGNLPWSLNTHETAILDTLLLVICSTPPIYYWVIRPYIIDRNKALAQVSKMATIDPLTRLPNRRLLNEYLGKLLSSTSRHQYYGAVLLLDLDLFKIINDRHGHDAGDAVLIAVADRLIRSNRAEDMVSRLGGDEFVVVLGKLDEVKEDARAKALIVAEKIAGEVAQLINFQELEFTVKCSIGICLAGPGLLSVAQAIKLADRGMYQAKQDPQSSIAFIDYEAAES